MMKKTLRGLCSGLLALAMLAALAVIPASAADSDEVTELYNYNITSANEDARTRQADELKNNLVNETASLSNAWPLWAGTLYGEDGPATAGCPGMYLSLSPQLYTAGSKHSGLPYEVIPGNYKKITENLKIELAGVKYPIQTKDIEALNLHITYLYRVGSTNSPVFDRELQVYVSLDGETYLPGTVGLRSAKLLGGGTLSTPKGADALLYDLETENLLDIPGVKQGDRIRKIMIMPNGDYTRTFGYFHVKTLQLNAYKTRAAFERLVPADKFETVKLDPRTVRQIPIEEGLRVANTAWSSGSTVYTGSPAGSSAAATTFSYRNYPANMLYHGPVYARQVDSTRELFQSGIVNGEHMNGFNTDNVYGMDCQCFVWNAISRVSRTYSWAVMITPGNPHTTLVGEEFLKTRPFVQFTDYDVVTQNTPEDMFRAYALIDTGDIMITYRTNASNSVHTRLAKANVPVYNADGSLDPNKSYIYFTEQSSGVYCWVRLPNGNEESVKRDNWANYLRENPGAEILFTYNTYFNSQYSYQDLLNTYYIGYTLDEYKTGEIELERVECVIAPKEANKPIWEAGTCISYSSNYRVIGYEAKLEDRTTGTVLYDDDQLNVVNYLIGGVYDNDTLNNKLTSLPNGDYRLSFTVKSGPFTSLEQSVVPATTKSVDFTVTGRSNADKVTLDMPASISAGQSFTVTAKTSAAFDAADIEVKFDQDKLTFTGADQLSGQTVKQDGGIVRIVRISAGSSGGAVAALNFTAKDAADTAQSVLLKSAYLSTAADANGKDIAKATGGTAPDASLAMKDVMPTHWYHDAVNYVLENGVMSGYSANTFGPNNTLTRAMVVQVLYNKENKPASNADNPFKDIASDQWYFNAVRWGADKGVVAGYGGGVFKPDDNVTVEQVAVILHNYAGKPAGNGDAAGLGAHSDWAEPALKWAAEKGLLRDMPYDAVTAPATRAQTAQMLMNYLENT